MSLGSWEILEQRKRTILVCTIAPPDLAVSMNWEDYIEKLQLPPGSQKMRIVGLPFGPARNHGAKTALDNNFSYLGFLDSDVLPPPDMFTKLMETNLDIVSGLYYQRFWPYLPVMFNMAMDEQGKPQRVNIEGWQPGQIVPATFVPAGALLIKRRVLEVMFQNFPMPFQWGVDTAETQGIPSFSEDFTFSYRAQQLGFMPHVHTGIPCLHEVRAVIGPKWQVRGPDANPLFGVCGIL